VNRGKFSFKTFADFLVDPKNPIRFIGGRIIANVRIGFLEQFVANIRKKILIPHLDNKRLGRLFQLNHAAARGYLEDRIVDLYNVIELRRSKHLKDCQNYVGVGPSGFMVPELILQSLFYPGSKYLDPVRLIDLDTLSFEELVERVDKLEAIVRDFDFYKFSPKRKLVMDDSFKLLRIIMKSRKHGSLSFELNKE
jgi:hypothetical protein